MSSQIALFAPKQPSQIALFASRWPWTYHRGLPDRSGLSRYTHLIRSKYDPEETMARGRLKYDEAGNVVSGRDPTHWKSDKQRSVPVFMAEIRKLLSDGNPRTFNRICVELTGTTADVMLEKPIDEALWELVAEKSIAWSNSEGAVFFTNTEFVNWS